MKNGETKMKAWSKTLLSVYRYLESITGAIDNLIVKKGVNSMFYTDKRGLTTYDCANDIIELTDRKINLINLKVLVEDGLNKLPFEQKRVLMLFYVDGLKTTEVTKLMGCVERTFFRKKDEAIVAFGKNLKCMGFDEIRLSQMFGKEKWLSNLLVKNQQHEALGKLGKELPEYNFLKNVIKELSQINFQKSYGY